jgi:hypothetical protein
MTLKNYLYKVMIALSVLLNVILGGPSNQTFSARNWQWRVEQRINLVWLIDLICNDQEHCEDCWKFWVDSKLFRNMARGIVPINVNYEGIYDEYE